MPTSSDEKKHREFGQFYVFYLTEGHFRVGITEGSASEEETTKGSAKGLAEGTFGRSLVLSHSKILLTFFGRDL